MTTQDKNRKLIERFPFLLPHNRWTDEVPEDYDYSYTELDAMPHGWRIAFGEELCEEIREELIQADYLDKYRIAEIKEKYGALCWYDFGCTEKMDREIIPKYAEKSATTCIRCGKPATRITTGWISPYCDNCLPHYNGTPGRSISVEEFLGKSDSDKKGERL